MKEKKTIAPNECSLKRWILALVVGILLSYIVISPLQALPLAENRVDTFMGILYADIYTFLFFIPLFIGTAIAIKWIGKTSLKDFILGVNGKVNVKESFIILGLCAGGFAMTYLIIASNISWRGVDAKNFAFLLLFTLLVLWMQTTWEELIFRGMFIRWACKNDVRITKKTLIVGAVSSFIFVLGHVYNPEVTSQKGIDILLTALSYFLMGFVCFVADLHFGSLVPGIVLHWCNNFILSTVISQEISVITNPTLFVDKTPKIASWDLLSTVLIYLPISVYIVCGIIRRKKAAAAQK